jgi:hypothetical protein
MVEPIPLTLGHERGRKLKEWLPGTDKSGHWRSANVISEGRRLMLRIQNPKSPNPTDLFRPGPVAGRPTPDRPLCSVNGHSAPRPLRLKDVHQPVHRQAKQICFHRAFRCQVCSKWCSLDDPRQTFARDRPNSVNTDCPTGARRTHLTMSGRERDVVFLCMLMYLSGCRYAHAYNLLEIQFVRNDVLVLDRASPGVRLA